MKIMVTIKRVVDANVKVRVKSDNTDVDISDLKMAMNPFCEIAVEEAVRLKEAGVASEIIVVTVGKNTCQEQLRTALALGADRAIHIDTVEKVQPLSVAKLLQKVVEIEQPSIVLMGKQSIDGDNNQTGQMLAALTNMGQGTFASQVTVEGDKVLVTREVDGGLVTVELGLPALITTDLRLNEPRYASLPNIMKSKRKPIDIKTPSDLGVEISTGLEVVRVENPTSRNAGLMVGSVNELVDKLRNEAKVI